MWPAVLPRTLVAVAIAPRINASPGALALDEIAFVAVAGPLVIGPRLDAVSSEFPVDKSTLVALAIGPCENPTAVGLVVHGLTFVFGILVGDRPDYRPWFGPIALRCADLAQQRDVDEDLPSLSPQSEPVPGLADHAHLLTDLEETNLAVVRSRALPNVGPLGRPHEPVARTSRNGGIGTAAGQCWAGRPADVGARCVIGVAPLQAVPELTTTGIEEVERPRSPGIHARRVSMLERQGLSTELQTDIDVQGLPTGVLDVDRQTVQSGLGVVLDAIGCQGRRDRCLETNNHDKKHALFHRSPLGSLGRSGVWFHLVTVAIEC